MGCDKQRDASPSRFQIPPVGNFAKYSGNPVLNPPANFLSPKNIIYDSTTALYWVIMEDDDASEVRFASASTPAGPWTLDTTHSFDPGNHPNGPCWLKHGSTFYIYYMKGTNYGSMSIRYATASAVTGPYTEQGKCLSTDGTLGTGWESGRVGEPFVFQLQSAYGSVSAGTWVMFYMGDSSANSSDGHEQTGYATASNPAGPWTKYSGNPVIAYGATNNYDNGLASDPSVYELNGKLYINYDSARTSPSGSFFFPAVSYATTTNLTSFTKGNVILGSGGTVPWTKTNAYAWDFLAGRGAVYLYNNTYYWLYMGNSGSYIYPTGLATMSAVNSATGYPPDQV